MKQEIIDKLPPDVQKEYMKRGGDYYKKNNGLTNWVKERWVQVLPLLQDGKIIKLPENNYKKILMEIDSVLNNSSFTKYKIFDYRIKDQLILQ